MNDFMGYLLLIVAIVLLGFAFRIMWLDFCDMVAGIKRYRKRKRKL